MTGLGSATWHRLARMAAAGILAAGTGVLTAALLAPTAPARRPVRRGHSGMFATLPGTPAYAVTYTATAANVVYP